MHSKKENLVLDICLYIVPFNNSTMHYFSMNLLYLVSFETMNKYLIFSHSYKLKIKN